MVLGVTLGAVGSLLVWMYSELRRLQNHRTFEERQPCVSPVRSHSTPLPLTRLNLDMTETPGMSIHKTHNVSLDEILQSSNLNTSRMIETLQRPSTKLTIYSGEPLDFYPFIRSFENTMKDCADDGIKLNTLYQHCSPEVQRSLQSFLVLTPSEGFKGAWDLLLQRYGSTDKITQAWLNRINSWPNVQRSQLQEYVDDLKTCVDTLRSLGASSELDNRQAIMQILQKVPYGVREKWLHENYKIKNEQQRRATLDDVCRYLTKTAGAVSDPTYHALAEREESVPVSHTAFSTTTSRNELVQDHQPIIRRRSVQCFMCSDYNHILVRCPKFRSLSVPDRTTFVTDKKLCIKCFSPKHDVKSCAQPRKCRVCNEDHHTFLHVHTMEEKRDPQTENSSYMADCSKTTPYLKSALPIVMVRVGRAGDPSSKFIETYAMFDPCGTSTHCDEELRQRLQLQIIDRETYNLTTLTEKGRSSVSDVVALQISDISGLMAPVHINRVTVHESLNIDAQYIPTNEEIRHWRHLEEVELHENKNTSTKKVQLLIGNDMSDLLCPLEVRKGNQGEPFAVRLPVGWAVTGSVNFAKNKSVSSFFTNKNRPVAATENTRDSEEFQKIWALDEHELDDVKCNNRTDKILEIYEESICMEDGKYSMRIPFESDSVKMPDNRIIAETRLQSLKRRLLKNPSLMEKYAEKMNELIAKGHAEIVTPEQMKGEPGRVNYIPHHPVIHPRKKMRPVFACNTPYKGKSLNDHIPPCPDLSNNLGGVLIRFRQGPIAVRGDIDSMFHQVLVWEVDRDFLRFLWWKDGDPTKEVVTYRMRTHLFGGAWSPSAAMYALRKVAEENKREFSEEAVETVKEDFYVDDWLKAVFELDQTMCEERAIELVNEIRTLLKRGGFIIRKWMSNCRPLLNSLPETELAKELATLDLDHDNLPTERTLGVLWDAEVDAFVFSALSVEIVPETRRGILSLVSSVFDPMGFVTPYLLCAKLIIQNLCRCGLGWDDKIPEELMSQWKRWVGDLPKISEIRIPRCLVVPYQGIQSVGLHHFADASEKSYAAVSYLRVTHNDGTVRVSLLKANNRLAPLRGSTIPRLELAAAAEAARLHNYLTKEMTLLTTEPPVFWTDSMITLWYIMRSEKSYQRYVTNRLAIITEYSSPTQWRFVPSADNNADDASRGMTATNLLENDRWLNGPSFMAKTEEHWPHQPEFKCQELESMAEVKKEKLIYVSLDSEPSFLEELFGRYSSWHRLKKAVAWLARFAYFMQTKKKRMVKGPLKVSELRNAERLIIKEVQKREFTSLASLKALWPKRESDGLVVVGGRLQNCHMSERAKHPWILPYKHHVTEIIIREYHILLGHCGVERVLAELLQKFWIVKARCCIKTVLKPCVTCARRCPPGTNQLMGPLPSVRITPGDVPFKSVGVDYFGPFIVKRGRTDHKRYVCLFTCLKCRAVHLELCWSLDTDSCIQAILRFVARRGEPEEIHSDKGTNLTGAEAELKRALKELDQSKIIAELRKQDIDWYFNTPKASWMGGIWERQIRTTRKVLKAVVGLQRLDEEGLSTFLCIAESIINGRPITKTSEDPADLSSLTPNHLLLMRSGSTLPLGAFDQNDLYRRRWRQVQYLADVFWKRWTSEYVPLLQSRQKWVKDRPNMKKGELVILTDELSVRGQWPLGLVVDTYESKKAKDGRVRSVSVKTQSGTYDRPVGKLCLLEGAGP